MKETFVRYLSNVTQLISSVRMEGYPMGPRLIITANVTAQRQSITDRTAQNPKVVINQIYLV